MKIMLALGSVLLFVLMACSHLFDAGASDGETFFPLKTGQQWTYRITESDMEVSRISFPKRFTVSVVGEQTVENKKYYLVANYFAPKPTPPDTILVRSTGSQVFVRFVPEQEEHLFYTFAPPDTTWSVPWYTGPSTDYARKAALVARRNSSAAISWDLRGYPDNPPFIHGRTESGWGETFERGIGRTEIVSSSQGFGKIVWKLE